MPRNMVQLCLQKAQQVLVWKPRKVADCGMMNEHLSNLNRFFHSLEDVYMTPK